MKKIELVYNEILFNSLEKKNNYLTQAMLSRNLGISLSTVNLAMKPLTRMNAVTIKRMGFRIIDTKKILYYWASIRNLEKDIIYSVRLDEPVRNIEKQMPDNIVFTAFSAYKYKFKDVPADYSEVYVYGSENIIRRTKEKKSKVKNIKKNPNLFVLSKNDVMHRYGKTATLANLFVDLWNLRQWYAKDFLKSLEEKIDRILE